jgi:hypothetical protein
MYRLYCGVAHEDATTIDIASNPVRSIIKISPGVGLQGRVLTIRRIHRAEQRHKVRISFCARRRCFGLILRKDDRGVRTDADVRCGLTKCRPVGIERRNILRAWSPLRQLAANALP